MPRPSSAVRRPLCDDRRRPVQRCRLLKPEEDGTWGDLWFWRTKADAEEALAHTDRTPLFADWGERVDMVQFEWASVLSDH